MGANIYRFQVAPGQKGLPIRKFPLVTHTIMVSTVAQNEAMHSKREVQDAKAASELVRMLGYPSNKDINQAISIDCHITNKRVIYGTPVPILKGKSVH